MFHYMPVKTSCKYINMWYGDSRTSQEHQAWLHSYWAGTSLAANTDGVLLFSCCTQLFKGRLKCLNFAATNLLFFIFKAFRRLLEMVPTPSYEGFTTKSYTSLRFILLIPPLQPKQKPWRIRELTRHLSESADSLEWYLHTMNGLTDFKVLLNLRTI